MCKGNPNCKDCACSQNADGAPAYKPEEMAMFINKHIYEGKASTEVIQDAYVSTMTWIEEKKLPFTEETISSNKEELKVVINDPNYLKDKETEKPGWQLALVFAVIIYAIYWVNKQQ